MFQIPNDPDFDYEFLDTAFSTDFPKTDVDRPLANVDKILPNGNPTPSSIASNTEKRSFFVALQEEKQTVTTVTEKCINNSQCDDNYISQPQNRESYINTTKRHGYPSAANTTPQSGPKHNRLLSRSETTSIPVSSNSAIQPNLLSAAHSPIGSSSLSSHSEFLAEWNDSDFFNPKPKEDTLKKLNTNSSTPPNNYSTAEAVTRKVNKTVRQRRFPGPAGLLPPRRGCTSLIAPEEFLDELKSEENDPPTEETELLSQSSGSVFEGGAWSAMLDDLGTPGKSLLKSMNLASIKTIGRNLRSYKVPFLAVLVQSVDASLPDAAIGFKDPTGEMHGVIHRDVWDQFGSDIAVGTVLVLRNVGIMSAGMSSRQHVVNITGRNLTAIYSPKDELNVQLRQIHAFAASSSSKLLDEWEKVETQHSSASPISTKTNRPLLNNNSPSGIRLRHPSPYNSTSQFHSGSSPGNLRPQCFNKHSNPGVPRFNSPSSNNSSAPQRSPSPFVPMPSRRSDHDTTLQKHPVANNHSAPHTSSFKQHPTQKSPSFAIKAPSTIRPAPESSTHTNIPPAPNINSLQQHPPPSSSSSRSTIPQKKPKLSQNAAPNSSKAPGTSNPFQVHDSSMVDSLLDGIDTDSLFGDF
uniref:Homologous recombination OB-fold protein OB-fold domain-containing protein n=1 Tax=Lygus hesperus TaxID=30085 RepID=A0A0A9WLW7_LYGHE